MRCPASKEKLRRIFEEKENDDEHAARQSKTYAEIAWGCFTALRKRAAFAAASSRFVAAVEGLDFFGRLSKRPEAARRDGRARALIVGRRLATRGDFGFSIVRPVLEARGEP